MSEGWVGFDLDGTIARYEGWKGTGHIGEPIPLAIKRLKRILKAGVTVKVVTARVSKDSSPEEIYSFRRAFALWSEEHIGPVLELTAEKDYSMLVLFDDRARGMVKNAGRVLNDYTGAEPLDTRIWCLCGLTKSDGHHCGLERLV